MANIYCTHKLAKLIGSGALMENGPASELGDWNGHLFSINRRKCMILTNDRTCYTLVFYDILKKQLANFDEIMLKRFIDQTHYDGVNFPIAQASKVFEELKPRFVSTNNNRSILGTLNKMLENIKWSATLNYANRVDHDIIEVLNGDLNRYLVRLPGVKASNFTFPRENMQGLLNQFLAS